MNKIIVFQFVFWLCIGCKKTNTDWYLIQNDEQVSRHSDVFAYTSGYIDAKGDTVIPLDKYTRCFTDTVRNYVIVLTAEGKLIGINKKEKKLFNAVWSGEGTPVGESDGMILITENGKYGFANSKGEIVIKPSYDCASSFYEGTAKVSNDCSEGEDEHERWKMNTWFEIDKKGSVVK